MNSSAPVFGGRRLTAFVSAVACAVALTFVFAATPNPVLATPIPAGSTVEVQATGVAGVPSDASAVAVNLTIVGAAAPGFATLYPCGAARPDASNINYAAGQTVANSAIAKPGTGGKICIYSSASADVLLDVAGYFPAGSDFTPIPNPTRTLDTRNGVGAPAADLAAGQTLELTSTGVAGVPSDASAVAVNLTIVGAAAPGFATLYPCGAARPEASNINYAAGQTVAASTIAKPGTGGKICIYTFATADVLLDVAGYFPAGSDFTPIPNPTRTLDTRNGIGAPAADLAAGQTLELASTGLAGVPGDASAVAVNLTIVGAAAAGFATLYPCGAARPEASNINYAAGQTIANSAIAKPGTSGKICIYTFATADVLVDVAGFFPAGSDYTPIPNPTRVLDTRNGIGTPTTTTPPPPPPPPPPPEEVRPQHGSTIDGYADTTITTGGVETVIRYPTSGGSPATGVYPLVYVGHGNGSVNDNAIAFHNFLVKHGYVLAAPQFGSNITTNIALVQDVLDDVRAASLPVDLADRTGAAGTSMGGITSINAAKRVGSEIDAVYGKLGYIDADGYSGPPLFQINEVDDPVIRRIVPYSTIRARHIAAISPVKVFVGVTTQPGNTHSGVNAGAMINGGAIAWFGYHLWGDRSLTQLENDLDALQSTISGGTINYDKSGF